MPLGCEFGPIFRENLSSQYKLLRYNKKHDTKDKRGVIVKKIVYLIMLLTGILVGTIVARPVHAATVNTPVTLYLHGHHGGPNSMMALMASAEAAEHAHTVVTATVTPNGAVRLTGDWPVNTRRPLVKVVFENNQTLNYDLISSWLRNVLVALQQKYQIHQFNIVAHSLGNAAVLFYELHHSADPHLPRLDKYVAIAGNFDGIPGQHRDQHPNHTQPNGKPAWQAPPYRQALALRHRLSLAHTDVLNIYGDWNRQQHSDGKILNASSRALKQVLGNKVHSYRAMRFVGWQTQHSQLRLNPRVAMAVDQFLWPTHS